jgi:hypothetical protein
MAAHDRVLFEIYREAGYDRQYRVVYFTELDEHTKDMEIARALAGDHYHDGYLRAATLHEARRAIAALLERLNRNEAIAPQEVAALLSAYEG